MALAQVTNFDRNPRRKQELTARPLIDAVYAAVFGMAQVRRYEKPDGFILDAHYGVDVQLRLSSGMMLTGQEKALSHKYASFNSLTVEFEQVATTGEAGDWFRLACQFYFCGYLSPKLDGFTKWIIVNWPAIVIATDEGSLAWRVNANRDGHARASFRYIDFDQIPANCLIARSK